MNRTERLTAILLMLQSRGRLTARELAETFGVSERTIYRDVQGLSEGGVPVVALPGPSGGYGLIEGYKFTPSTFSPDEATALLLGAAIIDAGMGTPWEDAIRTARLKMEQTLPQSVREYAASVERHIAIDVGARDGTAALRPMLARINRAIADRRRIGLTYYSLTRDDTTDRQVDPYGLIYQGGTWYLVGFCHLRLDRRMFRVSRIRDLTTTDESFQMPEGFSLRKYAQVAWQRPAVRVVMQVSPWLGRWARENWRRPFTVEREGPDGWVLALDVEEPEWLIGYCLSYHADVELLAPADLRERVAAAARRVVDRYQTPAEG